MTIREATSADAADLMRMARRFLSVEGPYHGRVAMDEGSVTRLVAQMLDGPDKCVLVADAGAGPVGMFSIFAFTHPITAERIAAELCWWMDPESRGGRLALELLKVGEAWARRAGAQVIEMIAPNERVASLYDRLGYDRSDIHYRKAL